MFARSALQVTTALKERKRQHHASQALTALLKPRFASHALLGITATKDHKSPLFVRRGPTQPRAQALAPLARLGSFVLSALLK